MKEKKSKQKIIVVGIDGATFTLLKPWMDKGYLPNFMNIYEKGAKAMLRSVTPAVTIPAWTSFSTGVNPGKHGAYDFLKKTNGDGFRPITSKDIGSRHIWQLLTDNEKKVIVINAPTSYPPERVNGFLISGMLTPNLDSEFTYPKSLKDELLKCGYKTTAVFGSGGDSKLGGEGTSFARSIRFADNKTILEVTKAFDDVEEIRARTAFRLMDRIKPDFTFVLFDSSDRLEHQFWTDDLSHILLRHYGKLDSILSGFLKRMDDNTVIMLVSDHGMKPLEKIIHVNNVLEDLGLFVPNTSSRIKSAAVCLARKAVGFSRKIGVPVHKILAKEIAYRCVEKLVGASFNKEKTKACFINASSSGIWVDEKDRDYEKTRDRIVERFNALKDPDKGDPVIKAYRREDIYKGPYVKDAPGIMLDFADGYNLSPIIASDRSALRKVHYMVRPSVGDAAGQHAKNGIFMAYGTGIKNTRLDGLSITDAAPTIIHMMGLPVPEDMDGRVAREIFEPGSLFYEKKISFKKAEKRNAQSDIVWKDRDREIIEDRLRSFGYL